MQAVIACRDAFGEAQLAHRISDYLPEQGQLFVGNSTVVRLIDALSQLPAGYPVYSNRGASGIDGLLSTAAGVQRASGKPTLAIVGDLSALYDLNALALLRRARAAGINCGEQQRRANFLAAANAEKRARAFLSDAAKRPF